MSYQSGTPFLNLPQTVGSDHRDWFDTNEAFLNLDTKMKTLWDGSASVETILTALQENVATLATDVSTLSGIVSSHTSTITTINESLVLINTALNALNTQVVGKFDSVGIADAYDATHGVYAVGDVVTYNGQRYVCTTAVTAAEPFDVSKWNAEDIQTVIENLKDIGSFVDISSSCTFGHGGGLVLYNEKLKMLRIDVICTSAAPNNDPLCVIPSALANVFTNNQKILLFDNTSGAMVGYGLYEQISHHIITQYLVDATHVCSMVGVLVG